MFDLLVFKKQLDLRKIKSSFKIKFFLLILYSIQLSQKADFESNIPNSAGKQNDDGCFIKDKEANSSTTFLPVSTKIWQVDFISEKENGQTVVRAPLIQLRFLLIIL